MVPCGVITEIVVVVTSEVTAVECSIVEGIGGGVPKTLAFTDSSKNFFTALKVCGGVFLGDFLPGGGLGCLKVFPRVDLSACLAFCLDT